MGLYRESVCGQVHWETNSDRNLCIGNLLGSVPRSNAFTPVRSEGSKVIRQREKLKCSSVTAEASADPTAISGSGQPRGVVLNLSKGLGPLFSEAVDLCMQGWGVTLDEAGKSLLHAIPREELGCEPSIANTHGTLRNEWLA